MTAIKLGNGQLNHQESEPAGSFVNIQGESWYRISDYQHMADFFISVVSNSNHWMFISSNGSLSAGRKDSNNALFPYYTVDKIHDYRGITGSRTWCLADVEGETFLWEPFAQTSEENYRIRRNLYKSIYGNKILFEEINEDLGLKFHYGWSNSDKFGWIRTAGITNESTSTREVRILDGIRNLLPFGADRPFQNEYSNLMDAYKKNELLEDSRLGLFVLSSIPVDRAEPSEALKATTVWAGGIPESAHILLSDTQLENFRRGLEVETEIDVRARRGAYYMCARYVLRAEEDEKWLLAAEVNQDAADVANLDQMLREEKDMRSLVDEDIRRGTEELVQLVGAADGLQLGKEDLTTARHFSNTMFNIMRGGVFADQYQLDRDDFLSFARGLNPRLYEAHKEALEGLDKDLDLEVLLRFGRESGNPDLERMAHEYLPLSFSRRHGDPSRPWNHFSIDIRNSDGSRKLNYQGNWRDIFQNWEALAYSYPAFLQGMISRFLNATTADGYNPYRITRDGIDWECPHPDDPWAYIGYWGDHQIIYLQKFLEQMKDMYPGKLEELMTRDIFVFANVPYRIRGFEELVKNPKDTIRFDHELNAGIEELVETMGADGRLLLSEDQVPVKGNLVEKLLITLLAKLSNFIPDAGIWLNTQRPEWNDANNALVGSGVSMVTLYYMRRFLEFLREMLEEAPAHIPMAEEVRAHMLDSHQAFEAARGTLESGFGDAERFELARTLGEAGASYRQKIYSAGFSATRDSASTGELMEFMDLALDFVDRSIVKNRREDGLYHAYNLVSFGDSGIRIRHLYEMLEGQVAVLSSGLLSVEESLSVLDALKASRMFRDDQYSYMLYPDRQLPRFEEKNNIDPELLDQSDLLQKLMLDRDRSILVLDAKGAAHFNGSFRNAADLSAALDKLDADATAPVSEEERARVLEIYERTFDHQSFTGRSGTFYGYEGLGSIYWHMVSKLLLATQECYFRALDEQVASEFSDRLKAHYYEIKAGIGVYKSPALYGAFPTDAYSHTPGGAGARQPGLTGQVKEDVITRFGELGLRIRQGKLEFNHRLLNRDEVLEESREFTFLDRSGEKRSVDLEAGQLAFTFCQVPVICTFGKEEEIRYHLSDGSLKVFEGNILPGEATRKIFARDPSITLLEVYSR